MKAAGLYEFGKPMSIEEIDLDPPQAGEVRVKIGGAGICRSELHIMKGEANHKLPAVLGHEGSGTVLEIGEGVTRVKPGDRVILSFVPFCGHCHFCLNGRANLCDTHASTAGTLFDGTTRLHKGEQRIAHMGKVACFAEEAVVPETGCVPIPSDIPLPQAALIGCCVPTGVGAAMFNAKLTPGSTVAVIGVGESTQPNLPHYLHYFLELPFDEFYREVRPTWKLGLRFNWGKRDHFNYPFMSQFDYRPSRDMREPGFYCGNDVRFLNMVSAAMEFDRSPVFKAPNGGYIMHYNHVTTLSVFATRIPDFPLLTDMP